MRNKRFFSALLAVVLAFSALSSGVMAAEGGRKLGPKNPPSSSEGDTKDAGSSKKPASKKKAEAKKDPTDSMSVTDYMLDIEARYYVTIVLPENLIPEMRPYLKNIDVAFSRIGAPMVRMISQSYEQNSGSRIQLNFQYFTRTMVMGAFEFASGTMYLFVPYPGVDMPDVEGGYAAVHTVLHEFGHAFHYYVAGGDNFGTVQNAWMAFNGGLGYSGSAYSNANPNASVFPSAYGASQYGEDFAEVFAGMLGTTSPVAKSMRATIAGSSRTTGIERKCRYMEQLISQYSDVNGTAMKNLASVFG